MRRLCVVSAYQFGGGAEYQMACLLDALSQRGDLEIFFLARHIDPSQHVPYQVVKIGEGQPSKLGFMMDAGPLYQALQTIRPDCIYQRVANAYTGITAHYARRHGARMLWHIAHDSDVSRGSSFFGRHPIRRRLEKEGLKYGIRRAHRIVAQTSTQAQLLEQNYGRTPDAILPNFHPMPTESLVKDEQLTVVWIANLKPIKRPDLFVRLAATLQKQPVKFIMIGSPPSGSGDAAWGKELMRSIEVLPNLAYLGQLPQSEVNAVLARAHLFVNTSVQEGFPNTFIQAWMRGVPVVSQSVNPDGVLDRERIGIFAETHDGLIVAVRKLLSDHALREEYGRRAQQYAAKNHSLANIATLENLLLS